MKYLTLKFIIIMALSSCNIKEAKNHDTTIVTKQGSDHKKTELKTADIQEYEELELDQMARNQLWNIAIDNDIDIKDRIETIESFFSSFNEHFNHLSSHYTIFVLKNEIFKKLEYFQENIRRLSKIDVNKNHINTKRGKLKDIYIQFVKEVSLNSFLYESILAEDYLKNTNKNIFSHFLRNISEIKISNSLRPNNQELIIENLTKDEIFKTLSNLEQAAQIKISLTEKGFKFIFNKSTTNTVKNIQISEFQLDTNHDALEIQKYIDIFLN